MSCTPQLLNGATLSTGNTCTSQGLLDATLQQCVDLRGAIDGTVPFWHNEANVGSTSSLSGWPCGCFYYNGGGGAHRLYYNVAADCGTANDYRAYDGCGCAAVTDSPPPPSPSPPPPPDSSA